MKKPLMGMLLMLAMAWAVGAQEVGVVNGAGKGKPSAAVVADSSTAEVSLASAGEAGSASNVAAVAAIGEAAAEPPAAAPVPKFVFGERDDYRWQLGVGLEFFRFQSNLVNASMVGLNTTLTYSTNSWFGVEGDIVTGFAPAIYDNEHVKYFGGGGGIHIGSRRARWEPWGHAIIGGGHLQPQFAGVSRTAMTVQAGGGVDYRLHSRLSVRVEGDYVYSRFFNQTQNNFQGVAGIVLHF
jgi:opacity protein-like surface antigen